MTFSRWDGEDQEESAKTVSDEGAADQSDMN